MNLISFNQAQTVVLPMSPEDQASNIANLTSGLTSVLDQIGRAHV